MDAETLRSILESLRAGQTDVDGALQALRDLPFTDLGYAMVDHHCALRQGVPEVIFAQGKTPEQVVGIARVIARNGQNVLMTRVDGDKADLLTREIPECRYHALARVATIELTAIPRLGKHPVALVCAGTSDIPVAEECAETLRMLGVAVERVYDVGVAGVHRLLAKRKVFDQCALAVVVAGMEGALPSAVGGLVSIPVVAVPTSVGYGAALNGFAALACMLTSCASGVTVCNIDNGFGAAFAAARILRSADRY